MSSPNQPSLETKPQQVSTFSWLWSVVGPLMALILVLAFFSLTDWALADGTFSSLRNLRTIAVQTCVVAIAALGMTVIIISGGIDLSAGTALALCATVLAWGLQSDVAFTCRYGDNFAGASRRFDQAQKNLAAAERDIDPVITARLQSKLDYRRERLVHLATVKLTAAQRSLDASQTKLNKSRLDLESASEESRLQGLKIIHERIEGIHHQLMEDLSLIQEKIQKLEDPAFRTDASRQWLMGVRNAPFSAVLSVLLAMGTGMLAGCLNGLLNSSLRIVSFIVTLGTMTIFLGWGNLLSGNTPIRPNQQYQIPIWLQQIVSNSSDALWFGLFPSGLFVVVLMAVLLALLLRYTVFGRYIFALGSSEATARLCGVNVPLVKISLYSLAGLFFGVAGVCHFSRASTGNPMSGMGMELSLIAAVVIGGGSLNGGRGSVIGTLAGAAIMQVIANGCTHLEFADPIKKIILGVIIIGAVTIDRIRQRMSAS